MTRGLCASAQAGVMNITNRAASNGAAPVRGLTGLRRVATMEVRGGAAW